MRSTLLLAGLALAGCDTSTETPSTLDVIRQNTAIYQSADRALEAGYVPASPCVFAADGDGAETAAMGYHHVNFDLIEMAGASVIDPAAPEIMLYEPLSDGSLRLVGVEFMVAADAWDGEAPPTLDGVEFAVHIDEETRHGIPFPHYDLHVWAWQDNPDGMYLPLNPDVSCEFSTGPGE